MIVYSYVEPLVRVKDIRTEGNFLATEYQGEIDPGTGEEWGDL